MKRLAIFSPILLTVLLVLTLPAFGVVAGKVTRQIIEETVERAAKRSGRELVEQATKKSANETLERLVKTYGDDVLRVVDDAGFELLESVPRYGDEMVEFAMKASPQARRAFAQNIPELLPLARRVGPDALELEAKSPGLSVQAFKVFGDDTGKVVAKSVPTEDVPRLLKYAEKADTPATKKMLLEAYEKEGKSLFERIPAKLVLATGLTASMLYGTHQATAPARAAAKAIADSPDVAKTAVSWFTAWGTVVVLIVIVLLLWRFGLMPWHRKKPLAATTTARETKQHDKD
jgi:hypothetical protein